MTKLIAQTKQGLLANWMNTTQQMHIQKLKMAKSTLNSLPQRKALSISFHKTKKDQIMEDRYTEIEKANRILLEKMSNIYTTKGNSATPTIHKPMIVRHKKSALLSKLSHENGVHSFPGYSTAHTKRAASLQKIRND